MANGWTSGAPVVDPGNLRSTLMLDVAREMLLERDLVHRAALVQLSDPTGTSDRSIRLLGVNEPTAIAEVATGRIDVSVLNPVAVLNMARLGTGPFETPLPVSTIAVMPHYDQLAFAVTDRLGFTSLADIAAARYPLRVSIRGTLDKVTGIAVDTVLAAYGFSLDDIETWGGRVERHQPMPDHPSRIGRLVNGELDAIFEEGTITWINQVPDAHAHVLPIGGAELAALQRTGFRPATLTRQAFPALPDDVPTLDYSGWPIYCATTLDEDTVTRFCQGLHAAAGRVLWQIGPAQQPPLPLGTMLSESPSTPFDVPLHPAAAAYWQQVFPQQ